jgi:hypothetical protein
LLVPCTKTLKCFPKFFTFCLIHASSQPCKPYLELRFSEISISSRKESLSRHSMNGLISMAPSTLSSSDQQQWWSLIPRRLQKRWSIQNLSLPNSTICLC